MKEIKLWLFIDISVESTNDKEDSPYTQFHAKEQVQSDPKKIKIDSTATKKFEKSDVPNLDSVVGGDVNLAKQISVEHFGFITKATPQGFLTVQISEDKHGFTVYREHNFALYYTEEDYPKYTRFVLKTFMFLTLTGHEKEFFTSDNISFKLVATVTGKDLFNYWLIVEGNQCHPSYNSWYLTDKWSLEKQEAQALFSKAPFSNFTILDNKGNKIGCPLEDGKYLF
jgi:hypothetical protein